MRVAVRAVPVASLALTAILVAGMAPAYAGKNSSGCPLVTDPKGDAGVALGGGPIAGENPVTPAALDLTAVDLRVDSRLLTLKLRVADLKTSKHFPVGESYQVLFDIGQSPRLIAVINRYPDGTYSGSMMNRRGFISIGRIPMEIANDVETSTLVARASMTAVSAATNDGLRGPLRYIKALSNDGLVLPQASVFPPTQVDVASSEFPNGIDIRSNRCLIR